MALVGYNIALLSPVLVVQVQRRSYFLLYVLCCPVCDHFRQQLVCCCNNKQINRPIAQLLLNDHNRPQPPSGHSARLLSQPNSQDPKWNWDQIRDLSQAAEDFTQNCHMELRKNEHSRPQLLSDVYWFFHLFCSLPRMLHIMKQANPLYVSWPRSWEMAVCSGRYGDAEKRKKLRPKATAAIITKR